jgi:hypothetical protein
MRTRAIAASRRRDGKGIFKGAGGRDLLFGGPDNEVLWAGLPATNCGTRITPSQLAELRSG